MEYIFENFVYICYFEVSALDGENIDVFKNLSFTCADRCIPQLSPIELQFEFQSTRPSTSFYVTNTVCFHLEKFPDLRDRRMLQNVC